MVELDRIALDPKIMGGKPRIKGTRATVGTVVGLVAAGRMINEVLAAYSYLAREDVLQALTYAACRAEEREFLLSNARRFRWGLHPAPCQVKGDFVK